MSFLFSSEPFNPSYKDKLYTEQYKLWAMASLIVKIVTLKI